MPIKRKKRLNLKVSTRSLIIEEAERIIARDGLEGLKLDDIADRLGIQRPSLYTHFDGRDGILAAIAQRACDELALQFEDDNNPDPTVTLSKGIKRLVGLLKDNRAYARLITRDLSTPGGLPAVNAILGVPERGVIPDLFRPMFKRLRTIFTRGVIAGVFERTDPYIFLTAIVGATMAALLQQRRSTKGLTRKITKMALGMVSARDH